MTFLHIILRFSKIKIDLFLNIMIYYKKYTINNECPKSRN